MKNNPLLDLYNDTNDIQNNKHYQSIVNELIELIKENKELKEQVNLYCAIMQDEAEKELKNK